MISPLIRRATPTDLAHIRQLEAQAPTAAHWSSSQYEVLFAAEVMQRIALVATRESGVELVVAFLVARCLNDEWEIENIVVDENERQAGVGSAFGPPSSSGSCRLGCRVVASGSAGIQHSRPATL